MEVVRQSHTVPKIGTVYNDKRAWHSAWMKKLDKDHIVYTTNEVYMCYNMYRRIVDMRKCLLPQNSQGSSRKQSNGKRHHNKK